MSIIDQGAVFSVVGRHIDLFVVHRCAGGTVQMRGLKVSFAPKHLPRRDLATPLARQRSRIDGGGGSVGEWWGVPTMSVSPGCSVTNPSARSWALASTTRSSAIMIEDGYSVRADITAIDARIRRSAATACGLVSDFAILPGTRGLLGIADDACSHRQVIAFSGLTIRTSPGLIACHHAPLRSCRSFTLTSKRASVSFVEPLDQP
ncbi:hypothetical protein FDV58_18335 [Bradyrhizobium elkanii]|uniref:Uncharacterized protein n=1 Tax=Bradyrhizobium elkanii TaxID=29448 RepID=A0A4U6RY94_BRAEL|nr:hypothetical protein [Bradyrhizobium elkanii]TKV80184.1 hypothetical protein FDV58_18335 [Bradyrhizobium elkanii]